MLNASRHHGKGDGCHAQHLPPAPQVLNASRHHGKGDPRQPSFRTARRCAQRLSASRQGGPGQWRQPIPWLPVLNASRHHGKGDASALANEYGLDDLVLNASRHHGKGDTAGTRHRHRHHHVLNASRHHGKGDLSEFVKNPSDPKCSTPLGITARGTLLVRARTRRTCCAQRLSASRQGGHVQDRRPDRGGRVLNASRHHGKGDLRLAWSPVEGTACSTPLGITARGTTSLYPSIIRAFKCSTPLGITARGTSTSLSSLTRKDRSAQRLSASRQGGPGVTTGTSTVSCAQRLSASRQGGLSSTGDNVGERLVLNASRHHGKGDPR